MPLFLDLSDPQYASIAGANFVPDGRSQEVAVFRVEVPLSSGESMTLVADTCDPATTVGTVLSVHDECPDPWKAAREPNYLEASALSFNDDAPACTDGAMTTSGSPVLSRASKVSVEVDNATSALYILVQRDASTDVAGFPHVGRTFKLSAVCSVTSPSPTPLPTLVPTPVPSFEFVTRVSMNATLRIEFATPEDFASAGAHGVFAEAMATAIGFVCICL